MHTFIRRTVGGVAACALTVGVMGVMGVMASPVTADTQSHQDPRGDVGSVQSGKVNKQTLDVVDLNNTYSGSTLTVWMQVADRAPRGYLAQWVIKANRTQYLMTADYRRKEPVIDFHEIAREGQQRMLRGAETSRSCNGVVFDAKRNRLIAAIPRRCIGRDDSVRVGGIVGQTTKRRIFSDDSRTAGLDPLDTLNFGPALDRN